jgi:hypothetical protein
MVTSKKIIDKIMTQRVQEYMNKGYVLYLNSMRGSDGTQKIDLIKGDDFIRIYCERISFYQYRNTNIDTQKLYNQYCYDEDIFVVRIGNTELKNKNKDLIWSSNLNIIHTDAFYSIGNSYRQCGISTDVNDAIAYCIKNTERFKNNHNQQTSIVYRDNARLNIGYQIVKKQPKTKSIKPNHIQSVEKKNNHYYVNYVTPSGKSLSVQA